MENLKVFIVGYTGLVGKALAKQLASIDAVSSVVLIGRREDSELTQLHEKFLIEKVDFENLSKETFNKNFDGGFCCLGTTRGKSGKDGFIKVDYDYVVKVGELAKEGNCNQFHLVSSAVYFH